MPRSTEFLVVGDESPAEFELLIAGFQNELQPKGMLETSTVERLAVLWRMRRVFQAESAEIEKTIKYSTADTFNGVCGGFVGSLTFR